MPKPPKNNTFMEKMATFIVDKRSLFFLLYIFAIIFCMFSMNWVNVENDVTTYLPESTETRQGLVAMNENFIVSVDWATPLNKADNGKMSNLYIKIGYMF